MHFCPHLGCDFWGWLGLGNLRANGHPNGGTWRQFHCTSCKGYFLETQGTIFHGKQAAVELIVRVLACLAEGLGIRATARVFEVEPHTVLHWLAEAAEQLRAFSRYFLCDVHVEQLQLDELYAVLRKLKAGEISDDGALKRLERSPYWVWTAMDPLSEDFDKGSYRVTLVMRALKRSKPITWGFSSPITKDNYWPIRSGNQTIEHCESATIIERQNESLEDLKLFDRIGVQLLLLLTYWHRRTHYFCSLISSMDGIIMGSVIQVMLDYDSKPITY